MCTGRCMHGEVCVHRGGVRIGRCGGGVHIGRVCIGRCVCA